MSEALAAELSGALRDQLSRSVEVRDLRRLSGGSSHETWSFQLADGERLMARRDIEGGLLDGDGAVEFSLMRVLHELGLPVPRPWLRAGSVTVMERAPGTDARKLMARADHGLDPHLLGERLVGIQASLHALDWRGELAAVLGAPVDQVARWGDVVAERSVEPEPLLQAAISWLDAHRPRPSEPCLVHADFKANNLLVSPEGAVTVIDWEMAHAGDPVEDIAWTLLWNTEYDLVGGMLTREQYLQLYVSETGSEVDGDALCFWELFALVKLSAIFLTGVAPGAAQLPTLQLLGRSAPYLEHRIATRLLSALQAGAA